MTLKAVQPARAKLVSMLLLLVLLTPLLSWASAVAVPAPSLPDVLHFQLEDGRHGTAGLTLSFALPGLVEYECREIVFREARRNREIRIELLGVEPAKNHALCRMAKVPAPIRERIALPPEPGRYQIIFVRGEQQDRYELAVQPDAVTLEAKESPAFTESMEIGQLMRVDPRWLWLDLSFFSDESQRKMAPQRDALLRDLEAIGAKPFTPPPGRYLLDGFVRQIPRAPQTHSTEEEYFFQWQGDWQALRKVAERYQKYATVRFRRPTMQLWLSSRNNVISTSSGGVYTFILEKAPPTVTVSEPPRTRRYP